MMIHHAIRSIDSLIILWIYIQLNPFYLIFNLIYKFDLIFDIFLLIHLKLQIKILNILD